MVKYANLLFITTDAHILSKKYIDVYQTSMKNART